MKGSSKGFFLVFGALVILSGACQKVEPMLVSNKRLEKMIELQAWEHVLFTDRKPYKAIWTFSDGNIDIYLYHKVTGALIRKTKGTYSIGPRKNGARLRITSVDNYLMDHTGPIPGSYSPIRLNKKLLKFAANTLEDNVPGEPIIEGGLKMLEFVPETK